MTITPSKQRRKQINLRLTALEERLIREAAKGYGCSVSEWVRQAARDALGINAEERDWTAD